MYLVTMIYKSSQDIWSISLEDYGYWFPTNFGTGDYKYYIRRFQKSSSGTKTQMTINIGKTLVNWNSTTSGVAVGLILKSGTSAGGNTDITTCRIYDPSATVSNLIEAGVSNDNHKNPFSSNIDLYGNGWWCIINHLHNTNEK